MPIKHNGKFLTKPSKCELAEGRMAAYTHAKKSINQSQAINQSNHHEILALDTFAPGSAGNCLY